MVGAEMNQTLDILFGVTGQTLYFDAPEGVPSSVTSVSVFENSDGDDGEAESATTGSASIDSVSTTLTASVSPQSTNPRQISLTSVSNIAIGKTYAVTNSDGQKEFVEVTDIGTTYVKVRFPVRNSFVSTNTFQGRRISISVDSTWVADTNNISDSIDPNPRYRVRWVYVVGGVTYVHASYVDLVRYRGEYTVTAADVDARFPGWRDSLQTYDQEDNGRRLIAEAYRQVKLDLYKQGKADQMARNAEVIDELVVLRAALNREESKLIVGSGNIDAVNAIDKAYAASMTSLVSNSKIPFASDSGGGASRATRSPVWVR
jgi:hypothetical protein